MKMKLILITFSVTDEERSEQIIQAIKNQGSWARITPTSWCVKTDNKKAADIRNNLRNYFSATDRLFVVNISNKEWASYFIPTEVTNWLKEFRSTDGSV